MLLKMLLRIKKAAATIRTIIAPILNAGFVNLLFEETLILYKNRRYNENGIDSSR